MADQQQLTFGGDPSKGIAPSTYSIDSSGQPTAVPYIPTSNGSAVTSSTDFRNYASNLGNNANTLQGNSDNLMKLLGMFAPTTDTPKVADNSIYETRRTQLQDQQKQELEQLNSNYEARKNTLNDQQGKELDPINQKLGLIGTAAAGPNAYLAQQLELKKAQIVQSYKTELDTLFQSQQSSILQAHKAYGDGDFALAESEQKNAQKFQEDFYQRQKDFSSLFLQIYGQQRQDQQLQLQESQTQQKYLNDNNINSAFYQLAGSSKVYDSKTGKPLTYAQYQQMGGVGKPGASFPDVQVVQPQMNSASGKEYQDYVNSGGKLSFNDYLNMDANRKRSVTVNSDPTKEFDLRVKQAPAQVANLKAQGYGWDQISQYFNSLGIDPGTPEIDDALHRSFQSQGEYQQWLKDSYNAKHGA